MFLCLSIELHKTEKHEMMQHLQIGRSFYYSLILFYIVIWPKPTCLLLSRMAKAWCTLHDFFLSYKIQRCHIARRNKCKIVSLRLSPLGDGSKTAGFRLQTTCVVSEDSGACQWCLFPRKSEQGRRMRSHSCLDTVAFLVLYFI